MLVVSLITSCSGRVVIRQQGVLHARECISDLFHLIRTQRWILWIAAMAGLLIAMLSVTRSPAHAVVRAPAPNRARPRGDAPARRSQLVATTSARPRPAEHQTRERDDPGTPTQHSRHPARADRRRDCVMAGRLRNFSGTQSAGPEFYYVERAGLVDAACAAGVRAGKHRYGYRRHGRTSNRCMLSALPCWRR